MQVPRYDTARAKKVVHHDVYLIICQEGTPERDHPPTRGRNHGSALSSSQNQ